MARSPCPHRARCPSATTPPVTPTSCFCGRREGLPETSRHSDPHEGGNSHPQSSSPRPRRRHCPLGRGDNAGAQPPRQGSGDTQRRGTNGHGVTLMPRRGRAGDSQHEVTSLSPAATGCDKSPSRTAAAPVSPTPPGSAKAKKAPRENPKKSSPWGCPRLRPGPRAMPGPAGSPGTVLGVEYLLLALDPHVLHALLDVLALVGAALLALLQPRRRIHHLHGRDGDATALPG